MTKDVQDSAKGNTTSAEIGVIFPKGILLATYVIKPIVQLGKIMGLQMTITERKEAEEEKVVVKKSVAKPAATPVRKPSIVQRIKRNITKTPTKEEIDRLVEKEGAEK